MISEGEEQGVVWRFVEREQDGELWMQHPTELHAEIEYASRVDGKRRRIVVVTKAWVERQLAVMEAGRGGRVVFDAMIVVADGAREALVESIDEAVSQGGLERFGTSG